MTIDVLLVLHTARSPCLSRHPVLTTLCLWIPLLGTMPSTRQAACPGMSSQCIVSILTPRQLFRITGTIARLPEWHTSRVQWMECPAAERSCSPMSDKMSGNDRSACSVTGFVLHTAVRPAAHATVTPAKLARQLPGVALRHGYCC
jgi:hypothetical protein